MNRYLAAEPPLFEETQKFDQVWFRLLGLGILGGALFFIVFSSYHQLIQGVPFGDRPLPDRALVIVNVLILLFSIVMTLWLTNLKLTTRLDRRGLSINYWPLARRNLPLEKIASWQAMDYHPIRDYGGWGVRYSLTQRHWVYSVKGHRGVLLELSDGKKLMLGSGRADELAQAIAEAKRS